MPSGCDGGLPESGRWPGRREAKWWCASYAHTSTTPRRAPMISPHLPTLRPSTPHPAGCRVARVRVAPPAGYASASAFASSASADATASADQPDREAQLPARPPQRAKRRRAGPRPDQRGALDARTSLPTDQWAHELAPSEGGADAIADLGVGVYELLEATASSSPRRGRRGGRAARPAWPAPPRRSGRRTGGRCRRCGSPPPRRASRGPRP